MSAVGFNSERCVPDSELRHDQERAIQDRTRMARKKIPGLIQYPGQVDRSHSLKWRKREKK